MRYVLHDHPPSTLSFRSQNKGVVPDGASLSFWIKKKLSWEFKETQMAKNSQAGMPKRRNLHRQKKHIWDVLRVPWISRDVLLLSLYIRKNAKDWRKKLLEGQEWTGSRVSHLQSWKLFIVYVDLWGNIHPYSLFLLLGYSSLQILNIPHAHKSLRYSSKIVFSLPNAPMYMCLLYTLTHSSIHT